MCSRCSQVSSAALGCGALVLTELNAAKRCDALDRRGRGAGHDGAAGKGGCTSEAPHQPAMAASFLIHLHIILSTRRHEQNVQYWLSNDLVRLYGIFPVSLAASTLIWALGQISFQRFSSINNLFQTAVPWKTGVFCIYSIYINMCCIFNFICV